MAIAEMRKLNLAGMSYDRDSILNALHRTGAAEVKYHTEEEGLSAPGWDSSEERARLAGTEAALDILCSATERYEKEKKIKADVIKDGFTVTYGEFMAAAGQRERAGEDCARINAVRDRKSRLQGDLALVRRTLKQCAPYADLDESPASFKGMQHAEIMLGTIPAQNAENILAAAENTPLTAVKILSVTGDTALVEAACHKSCADEYAAALSEAGFSPCPFTGEKTLKEIYLEAQEKEEEILKETEGCDAELYAMKDEIRPLKIYCDYLNFGIEKTELSEKMLATNHVFLLEAYVPKDAEGDIAAALADFTVYYEFSDVPEDEMPPTLMKNREITSNFETITNMYSPPNAREMDPTTVMALFYSLFMGFIMADVGYGALMLIGGGIIYFRTRGGKKSGLNSLSGVFAIGGIFAIIMGALCNSYFGLSFGYSAVIPDAQTSMWSFIGINIPSVLVIALIIGCVQLGAGYFCRAVQCWRRGGVWDGIWDGITWVVFTLGVALALVGLVDEANCRVLAYVGGIMAGVGLIAAMLTAGRKEKLTGKLSKGFGALYGIINFASDVLSYARLYGLMLSGVVIASLASDYGVQFLTSGNAGLIILGLVILIVGHGFNIAMSLLSAYIHDARLQYVEFYGKFYEGDGRLFAPIGSGNRHVYLDLKSAENGAETAETLRGAAEAGASPAQ